MREQSTGRTSPWPPPTPRHGRTCSPTAFTYSVDTREAQFVKPEDTDRAEWCVYQDGRYLGMVRARQDRNQIHWRICPPLGITTTSPTPYAPSAEPPDPPNPPPSRVTSRRYATSSPQRTARANRRAHDSADRVKNTPATVASRLQRWRLLPTLPARQDAHAARHTVPAPTLRDAGPRPPGFAGAGPRKLIVTPFGPTRHRPRRDAWGFALESK